MACPSLCLPLNAFGVRSEPVRDPFRVHLGSVRGRFGIRKVSSETATAKRHRVEGGGGAAISQKHRAVFKEENLHDKEIAGSRSHTWLRRFVQVDT